MRAKFRIREGVVRDFRDFFYKSLSFDLLYHGLEITTGGQRIHDYDTLLEKIKRRGMATEGMEQYLAAFKQWYAA